MMNSQRCHEALQHIPAHDRDIWCKMGMALKSEFGDSGFELWEAWSQQADNFNSKDARDVWKSIRPAGKVGIGSLFHEAKAHGWRDDGTHQKPTPEELAERRRVAAERAAQEESEIARDRAETAKKAAALWKAASEVKADNHYLERKRVSPVATMREIDAGAAAAILGYAPKSGDEALTGRLLVVPVKRGDRLATVELIDGDGRKAALYGRGSKVGGYWAAQALPDGDGAGLTLLVGEGVATVLSAKESTGHHVVAGLSSGNLPAVAKAMRERYPAAVLVVLADLVKSSGEPDRHAIEAALSVGGLLAVPDFGIDRKDGDKDFNDLAQLCGKDAVQKAIASARAPENAEGQGDAGNPAASDSESLHDAVTRLAALNPLEYEKIREAEALRLDARVGVLDKEVSSARKSKQDDGGKVAMFQSVEPWAEPVDANQLLHEIRATIQRYIICDKGTAIAATLWSAFTWLVDAVEIAPIAVITAPEKRCGKSQLLNLLGKLALRPLVASNIGAAAVFRVIEAHCPTLLIDEADSFFKDNEELRGVINSGHTRQSAYVIRCVGDDHEPRQFSTWGAKAISGIGHLAETLMDRSIVLELRRKLPTETIQRLRHAEPGLFDRLASKLARFAQDAAPAISRARPELPEKLNDRAQDNWEPLLAIADYAGCDWPKLARDTALKLSGSEQESVSLPAELLADIQHIFETKHVDKISTADLIEALCDDDEAPWATYNRGKPISPRQVSSKLAGYGIKSKTVRIGYGSTPKGFDKSQFSDAFTRYLAHPAENALLSATTPQPSSGKASNVADKKSVAATDLQKETLKPLQTLDCCGVADKTGVSSGAMVEVEV